MTIEINQAHINLIKNVVSESAISARRGAGLGGEWGDGGASRTEERLKAWLDGVTFATTGKTEIYGHIIDQFIKENDPEYQRYIELKKKFEDKS